MIFAGILKNNQGASHFLTNLEEAFKVNVKKKVSTYTKDELVLYTGTNSDSDHDQLLANDETIVLGRAFTKSSNLPLTREELHNCQDVCELLHTKYWGKYIALQIDKKTKKISVTRDPIGQLYFFYYVSPDSSIIFSSELFLLFDVLKIKPKLRQDFTHAYLLYGNDVTSNQPPFEQIEELSPGFQLIRDNENQIKFRKYFDISKTYNQNWQNANIIEKLQATLKAWTEPYQNILVSLSGGIDSSCLSLCLSSIAKENQKVKAVNIYHSDVSSSNELAYAKSIAQQAGIELCEIDLRDNLPFDLKRRLSFKPNRPQPTIFLTHAYLVSEMLSSTPNSLFVSGHGGDHLFMAPPPYEALADAFLEHGQKGLLSELNKLAFYYRQPFYKVLQPGLKALMRRQFLGSRIKPAPPQEIPWMSKQFLRKPVFFEKNLIYGTSYPNTPPGKVEHYKAIHQALFSMFQEHHDYSCATFYPFIQRPAIEWVLGIPTYQLFSQGYDRYPFRKAFYDSYNTNVAWRRDKGETTGVIQLGIQKNLEEIQSLCLDGQVAKNNYFKKDALKESLHRMAGGDNTLMWPLIHLISLELFCTYWCD